MARIEIADKNHTVWQHGYTTQSEEDIGLDAEGKFYKKGERVLVVVHGGGLLTAERIEQAHKEGLFSDSIKYSEQEFSDLLDGKLADGTLINLFPLEEIQSGISGLPRRFGVVMPYTLVFEHRYSYYKKQEFIHDPLVRARTAISSLHLAEYFDQAQHSSQHNILGSLPLQYQLENYTPSVGYLLFLHSNHQGMARSSLQYGGRFLSVRL